MKFREDSFRGFQVTERTRYITDRQTDGRTDRRPGKNKMSPNPSGGDITRQITIWDIDFTNKIKTINEPSHEKNGFLHM